MEQVVIPEPVGISDPDALAAGLKALLIRSGLSYAQLNQAVTRLPRHPSRAAALPKSTVSDILRTGRVSKPALLAFLAACHVSDTETALWLAAWERARTAHLDRPPGAQRVRTVDAQLLGVHKAIEVEDAGSAPPAYVLRDADEGVRGIRHKLQEAARQGGLVVLVGSSSVGKSRSAYEAVRNLFPDWWLLHPDPDDPRWPEKLSETKIAPTVVWLDELQRYFEGAHSLTSDQVGALLRADTQIVMIGTLWSQRYAAFTPPPSDPLGPDPWRRQREVLQLARVVQVPDFFSDAEYKRARLLSTTDPRLFAGLQYHEYGLTQSIAAAPQLVERRRNADTYAMAVLNAAIDARRIGVLAPIPTSYLRAAAPAYCDNRAQAMALSNWFESAIDYCTHMLHGAAAALEPVASGMGEIKGYTVAEYLHQHAANERRHLRVPEIAWRAALEYVDDNFLVSRVARALYDMGDTAAAEQVAKQALAHAVEPDLLVDLHWTLAQCRTLAGRFQESLTALNQALAQPGISARNRARLLVATARTHRHLGQIEKAEQVTAAALAEATEADDDWAIGWALNLLTITAGMQGRTADALRLYDRALIVTRANPALTDLRLSLQINSAIMLGDLDQYDGAFAAARQAQQVADRAGVTVFRVQVQSCLGQLLFHTGRWDDALNEVGAPDQDAKDPGVACCDHGIAAVICFHRGETRAARRHLAAAAPHAKRIGNRVVGSLALARSLDSEQAGALPDALNVLTGYTDNAEEVDEIEDLLADGVRLATTIGDAAAAQTLTEKAIVLANNTDIPHREARVLYCRGLVDHDANELLRAAERYRAAHRPLLSAKALEAAFKGYLDGGDRGQARAAFTGAIEIYTSLGAATDIARLQAKL